MSCNIKFDNDIVFSSIVEEVNNDTTLAASVSLMLKNENHVKAIKEFYDIDINQDSSKEAIRKILEYHNGISPDINFDTMLNDNDNELGKYGYTNVTARDFGIKTAINFARSEINTTEVEKGMSFADYAKQQSELLNKDIDKKSLLISKVIAKVKQNIINRISRAKLASKDDVIATFKANNTVQIEKWFSQIDNTANRNLLAMYKEIMANKKAYFDKVFIDNRLSTFNYDKKESTNDNEFDIVDTQNVESENTNNQSEDNSVDDSTDSYLVALIRDGYKDYLSGIDNIVKYVLGNIKVLHSVDKKGAKKNQYDYNTDTPLGIPDYMDERLLMATIQSEADFTNAETFKYSILNIARNKPGFEGLVQLYDIISSDTNMLYRFYSNFGKTIIEKLEAIKDGDEIRTRVSNKSANKETLLRMEFRNSIKLTAISNNETTGKQIYQNILSLGKQYDDANKVYQITNDIQDKNALDEIKEKLITEITNQLKRYYPTIDRSGIANYVINSHNKNVRENINTLAAIINDTINGSVETIKNFYDRESEIIILQAKLKKAVNERDEISKQISELYKKDYLSKQTQTAAFTLAREMLGFTSVKIGLNSVNVHGNKSSDVINNSMITNIIKTLQSTIGLQNFGNYRSQSRQYDFSNIMIEHVENGQIINYGLFRKNANNNFVPTPYAHYLLRNQLFNGATNIENSTNVLYSEMSKGDYVATSFGSYFDVEQNYNIDNEQNITFGNYFMRIPSDAPKNFIITAPRYKTTETSFGKNDGLFIISNKGEIDSIIYNTINDKVDKSINKDNYNLDKAVISTKQQFIDRISSGLIESIPISIKSLVNKATLNKENTILYKYDNGKEIYYYTISGILTENKGKYYLSPKENGELEVKVNTNIFNSSINEAIESKIFDDLKEQGLVKRVINTNHRVYKQIRNIFVQELSDAANAINRIFVTDKDGLVAKDLNGNPTFREGFDNSEECARKLNTLYHVGVDKKTKKNKPILTKKGNVYVLEGNVFHSDRFTLIHTDENGNVEVENYGEKIFQEAFNFLYGGAKLAVKGIETKKVEKGVEVIIHKEQEEIIEKHLTRFINDYINDTKRRLSEYSEFISESIYTEENIEDYALNHFIAYVGFNDLFEGDSKFYKSAQDELKRAKESQASGVPYGIVNYEVDLNDADPNNIKTLPSQLDKEEWNKKSGIKLRNKFVGVTITNTIRTSDAVAIKGVNGAKEDGSVTKMLINAFNGDRAKAVEMVKGYHGTTVNDAQSYITFEEWVRRITAKGQYAQYKPLIEAIVSGNRIDPTLLNQFVQVQKNFYFDQHFDTFTGVIAPRQIKNAEFVLVPRFIKGTQLEQVYEIMKKHGIDQLNTAETSKAGKRNVLTLWDNQGNISEESIKDFEANVSEAREVYNYNYLYSQLETPQHLNAENKAGIQIMKKILDNISPNSKLYPIKEKFFKLYSANIKASFSDLMKELNLKLDKNGNLILTDGQFNGLNIQMFFDLLRDEVARLGLDSNAVDYFTLSDNNIFDNLSVAVTKMPTDMTNMSTKLESISQALFNSRITRQKLPGFHAAQITNVGFNARNDELLYVLKDKYKDSNRKDNLSKEEFDKLSKAYKLYYSKKKGGIITDTSLRYHPDGKSYIEIMLPASSFGFNRKREDGTLKSNEELLQELQEAGLDTMIGYRIPTEGKQSICVMKVVRFVDDALGSTIVVPDDWVSQTGSDFDIDSVYGINFATRIDRDGKIRKVEFGQAIEDKDYFRYVLRELQSKENRSRSKKVKTEIRALQTKLTEAINKYKEEIENKKKELNKEQTEAFNELDDESQELVKRIDTEFNEEHKEQKKTKDLYKSRLLTKIEGFNQYIDSEYFDKKNLDNVNKYLDVLKATIDNIDSNTKEAFDDNLYDNLEKLESERLANVEKIAKENDILSYNEYLELDIYERNSRDARNSEILQCMIDILSAKESWIENFSRSNFDKLVEGRDGKEDENGKIINSAIDDNVKKRRANRSVYNVLDQADYQEDVMSGAKLKAFSVTRDTFCSICNTVMPFLKDNYQISVIYRKEDGFTKEQLLKSYDKVEEVEGGFKITHDRFGWSKDNNNVEGMILTSYSSQTTAHILDAVKEGAIPNVNDLTFAIFKLFPDVGSDYATAVSFIMQPGISEIVKLYNANKSIYTRGSRNYVNNAIKIIADKIFKLDGVDIKKNAPISEYIEKLQKYNNLISSLFNANSDDYKISLDDSEVAKLSLSASRMRDRLKNQNEFEGSSPVEEMNRLLFDLGIVLQYNKLSHLSNRVSEYARVCNPDKFGAKQTIYDTTKTFGDIIDIIENEIVDNSCFDVTKDDKKIGFLQSIYPGLNAVNGVDGYITSDNMDSTYPPLNCFLKYASATSIKVNSFLFITQLPNFVNAITSITDLFSEQNNRLTEDIYKDFKNYVLNKYYNNLSAVKKHYVFKRGEGFIESNDINEENERRRICGYGRPNNLTVEDENGDLTDFVVEDINYPTDEEVRRFSRMSPAQKVLWIQSNFTETRLFSHISATLFNVSEYRRNKAGAQTIEFESDGVNSESIYHEFEQAYYNNNPLVALAALDIIKYGFVVEGFRMRNKAVNKMIKNNVLMDERDGIGTKVVKEFYENIANIASISNNEEFERLKEDYIRSHSNMYQIGYRKVKRIKGKGYELARNTDGIIYLNKTEENNQLLTDYGIMYKDGKDHHKANKYIKLKFGKDTYLYKINDGYNYVYLYPLNTLEPNEFGTWSVNPVNNKFPSQDYYKFIINNWIQNNQTITNIEQAIKVVDKDIKDGYKYTNNNRPMNPNAAKEFNINEKGTENTGGFEDVIKKVNEHFKETPNESLYLNSEVLTRFISTTGSINGSRQIINGNEYLIQRVKFTNYKNKYLGKYNEHNTIKEKNESLRKVIEAAKARGAQNVFNCFRIDRVVTKVNNDTSFSSVDENLTPNDVVFSSEDEVLFARSSYLNISRKSKELDAKAIDIARRFNNLDINGTEESINKNRLEIIRSTAEYVRFTSDDITNQLTNFFEVSNGNYIPINSDEAINAIRNDENVKHRFLKTILEARALVRNYEMINEFDVTSDDKEIERYLNMIKEGVNKLKDSLVIKDAEIKFMNDYLAKLSDNPLTKEQLLGLYDGYHSTSAFDAWINDLQETSNPLLQIITKEVMADVRSKEMIGHKERLDFKKKVEDIQKRANAAGTRIDFSHFIKNGKILQPYNEDFPKKIEELRDRITEAKRIADKDDSKYIDYLKAKFEYNLFKAIYTHQEIVDSYYIDMLTEESIMLDQYPLIYAKYKKLEEKKFDILNRKINGVLDDSLKEELRKVNDEIADLVSDYYYNPHTLSNESKTSIYDPNNHLTGADRLIYSLEHAEALRDYFANLKVIKSNYFEKEPNFDFEELKNKYLDVIRNYEERDEFGRITKPMSELMKHKDYVEAIEWMRNNTIYEIDEAISKLVEQAYKDLRAGKQNDASHFRQGNGILKRIAKSKKLYDNSGTIDATQLSDNDLDNIRKEQQTRYNTLVGSIYNDKNLINNKQLDGVIFSNKFYQHLKPEGIVDNPHYIATVKAANDILIKYYDYNTKTLNTQDISEEDIDKLIPLYKRLDIMSKYLKTSNGKQISKFINKNTEIIYNEELFKNQKMIAENKRATNPKWYSKWSELCEILIDENGHDKVVPNPLIFGILVPKGYKLDGTGDNTFVDFTKTNALRVINNYTERINTKYYYEKLREMSNKPHDEFVDWYGKNHIFNPITKQMVPLDCWTRVVYKQVGDNGTYVELGEYKPNGNQYEKKIKQGKANPNYKNGLSTAQLYKPNLSVNDRNGLKLAGLLNTTNYNSNLSLNPFEQEMKDLFEDTINYYARTESAKRFFKQGYMVAKAKKAETNLANIGKNLAKFVGYIDNSTGKESWKDDVNYANDKTINMPFTTLLKTKDSVKVDYQMPKKQDNESEDEYKARVAKFEADKKAAKEQNDKIHAELVDENWIAVMEDFIEKSAHFNAIQDNKYMLLYGKNMIDKLQVYKKNLGFNNYQKDYDNSTEDKVEYVKQKDSKLSEQYDNFIRRLVYDQWKQPNANFTRAGNLAQSFNSAKYMMLNVTGGIANVTVGETGIIAEALSKELFDTSDWIKGKAMWLKSAISFVSDMYSEKATTLASAICKAMNVIDFAEINGIVSETDAMDYLERMRDLAFSPQSSGEHFMQNAAMFSLMYSHRLYKNNEANGRTSYILRSEGEMIREAHKQALLSVLSDEDKRKYYKFVEHEMKDPNRAKEYAWFRKNLETEFANIYLNVKQQNEFVKARNEIEKNIIEEFNDDEKHPTLISQLDLVDGELGFKEGSTMLSLGNEAYKILGAFKGRVISLNKKIHGVYDKLGAAQIESQWWGGMVMQYHKHLPMGIMKRYRRQGYFNEERGTIEKGCYSAIKDFLAMPLHKIEYANTIKENNNLGSSELQSVVGVQNLVKSYMDFVLNVKLYWNLLPENDRAAMRRSLGGFIGAFGAICTAIALKCIANDDDYGYNFWIHEMDRLATESIIYTPIGLFAEAKKAWSSPVAIQGAISDSINTVGFICNWIIQGEEFDLTYQTGLYAGENKLSVMIKRNIPMYHSINMLKNLPKNNSYYKRNASLVNNSIVEGIVDWISE